jgi:hypothetical protein
MVVLNEIWEIVGIVTDFFPIFVVLALIGLFMVLLGRMIGGGALAEKFNLGKRLVIGLPVALMIMFVATAPTTGAVNAVAITIDSNVIFGGSVVTVKATGLTAATEYTLYATGNTETFNNVTFTASSSTEFVPVAMPDETDLAFTLGISASTAGQGASTATYYVALTDPAGFLPTDMFLNLVVPLILIGIIVGIAVAIVGGKAKSAGRRRR